MPILIRLGNLISCHPTKMFLKYMESLNEFERKIRKGHNLGTLINVESDDVNEEVVEKRIRNPLYTEENGNIENNNVNEEVDLGNDDTSENSSVVETVVPVDENLSGAGVKRSFGLIAFKDSLTTKGRPKKKCKQFVFNKGKADRQTKTPKSKVQNKRKKSCISKSITDSESTEDEDLDLILDDSDSSLDLDISDVANGDQ